MPKEVRCPTCRRRTVWKGNPYRPFCSQRCRMQDLGNWASDQYRIPGPPADVPIEESPANGTDDADP
ncbi:MAG: DNA gyrase inhibitor YacG [Candidatus Binatia bacterium]